MLAWLRNYIEESNEFHNIKSTSEELESQTSKLYDQVNQFSMVSIKYVICIKLSLRLRPFFVFQIKLGQFSKSYN